MDGYANVFLLQQNHIHVYRARSSRTGKPVVLKLCTVNHLDTLARLRLEWKMLSDFALEPSSTTSPPQSPASEYPGSKNGFLSSATLANMPDVIRPCAWEYLPDGGLTLVYLDEPPLMTLEEAFLVSPSSSSSSPSSPPPPPSASSASSASLSSPAALPTAKPRTQSDLIRILTVFSEVVNVLDCAHQSGITHNNSMFPTSLCLEQVTTFSFLLLIPPYSKHLLDPLYEGIQQGRHPG